uniref:Uncharacterized protein n=1 Tax=Romanomermis culicivorax TaxID=13658 RepID=A0A915HGX0_ROMCU
MPGDLLKSPSGHTIKATQSKMVKIKLKDPQRQQPPLFNSLMMMKGLPMATLVPCHAYQTQKQEPTMTWMTPFFTGQKAMS